MQYDNNLNSLRDQFCKLGIDAIFVGMHNAFGNYSDSISDIQYFSGFSGSNGRCFVSKDKAIISVDGRYVKQANAQVNNNLWKVKTYPDTNIADIIKEIMQQDATLGICKYSMKYNSYLKILELANQLHFNIKILDEFPVIKREISKTELILLNSNNTGDYIKDRLNAVIDKLNNEVLLITNPSMVGWITGLRLSIPTSNHSIIPNAVVVLSHPYSLPQVFCDLVLDDSMSYPEHRTVHENICINNFTIQSLDKFEEYIKLLGISNIKCDFSTTPLYFIHTLEQLGYNVINDHSINHICSIKTKQEIYNQREGALLTSLAMIKVLAMAETNNIHSELEAINMFFNELKKAGENNFVDFSFDPISAFGENTSIIHYNPNSFSDNTNINGDGLFLFDGGAHFKYSTTDMTRTIYIGNNPPDEIKKQYTLVLKSIIEFAMMKFPKHTKACTIDAIARAPLWQHGYNYAFGTGHGVSAFGNVHEYPGISTNSNNEILENMIITIEPGIYTSNTGIRMENMLLVTQSEYENYNKFYTINYIPFSSKLTIKEMLSNDEIQWLNNYNSEIRDFTKQIEYSDNNKLIHNWILSNTDPL